MALIFSSVCVFVLCLLWQQTWSREAVQRRSQNYYLNMYVCTYVCMYLGMYVSVAEFSGEASIVPPYH